MEGRTRAQAHPAEHRRVLHSLPVASHPYRYSGSHLSSSSPNIQPKKLFLCSFFQLFRIGQLLIAAAPGEFTTMAGRWLSSNVINLYHQESNLDVYERQWPSRGVRRRRSATWCWRAWPTRTRTTSPPGRSTRRRGQTHRELVCEKCC